MNKFSDDTIMGKAKNNKKLFVSHSELDTDRLNCRKYSLYRKAEMPEKC